MSIASISSSPWTNPFYAAAIGTAGTTTIDAMPDLAGTTATAGTAGTAAGGSGNGAASSLGQLMADVQSWLLQLQSESGASTTGGATPQVAGSAGTTPDANSVSATDGHRHGHHDGHGMGLLHDLDTAAQNINSALQPMDAPTPSATA